MSRFRESNSSPLKNRERLLTCPATLLNEFNFQKNLQTTTLLTLKKKHRTSTKIAVFYTLNTPEVTPQRKRRQIKKPETCISDRIVKTKIGSGFIIGKKGHKMGLSKFRIRSLSSNRGRKRKAKKKVFQKNNNCLLVIK